MTALLLVLALPVLLPPPPPGAGRTGDRIEGFHALYLRPSFVDGLQPDRPMPPPAHPVAPVVVLTPSAQRMEALGVSIGDVAMAVSALPGVEETEIPEGGLYIRIHLEAFRDLGDDVVTLGDDQVPMADLGPIRALPQPTGVPTGPVRPPPEGPRSSVVIVVLDPEKLAVHGLDPLGLAVRAASLDAVTDAEVAPTGESILLNLKAFEDLTTAPIPVDGRDPVPLGFFGRIQTFPASGVPRMPVPEGRRPEPAPPTSGAIHPALLPMPVRPPAPQAGHDLEIVNELGTRVVVHLGGREVGELNPRATAVIHDVHPGTYTVVLASPDGARRELTVEARPR